MLGLKESDVLPELSKKSQALLHIAEGEEEHQEEFTEAAAEDGR